jgi:hypothetical protein
MPPKPALSEDLLKNHRIGTDGVAQVVDACLANMRTRVQSPVLKKKRKNHRIPRNWNGSNYLSKCYRGALVIGKRWETAYPMEFS